MVSCLLLFKMYLFLIYLFKHLLHNSSAFQFFLVLVPLPGCFLGQFAQIFLRRCFYSCIPCLQNFTLVLIKNFPKFVWASKCFKIWNIYFNFRWLSHFCIIFIFNIYCYPHLHLDISPFVLMGPLPFFQEHSTFTSYHQAGSGEKTNFTGRKFSLATTLSSFLLPCPFVAQLARGNRTMKKIRRTGAILGKVNVIPWKNTHRTLRWYSGKKEPCSIAIPLQLEIFSISKQTSNETLYH